MTKEEWREWFSLVDADGSGMIDSDELRWLAETMYREMYGDIDEPEVEEAIAVRRFI